MQFNQLLQSRMDVRSTAARGPGSSANACGYLARSSAAQRYLTTPLGAADAAKQPSESSQRQLTSPGLLESAKHALHRAGSISAAGLAACALVASGPAQGGIASAFSVPTASAAVGSTYAPPPPLSPETLVYDGGQLLKADKRQVLERQLADLESTTGWRLRVLTRSGPGLGPNEDELRAAWRPDKRSIVLLYDLTSPNLITPLYLGDDVLVGEGGLRRPWWSELTSRYGNMFFVRDEGEQAALLQSTGAIVTCLQQGGCKVVPGLPEEQYGFTLALSIAGGLLAGSVVRLEPQGFVQSRWVWLVVFSPLWGPLFVNFGIGPVISRTDDPLPIVYNVLGFLAGAAAPTLIGRVLSATPPADNRQ